LLYKWAFGWNIAEMFEEDFDSKIGKKHNKRDIGKSILVEHRAVGSEKQTK
jgi:hypothetical protein